MITRFFLFWFVLTAIAFGWTWLVAKPDKTLAKMWLKRALQSAVVSVVLIGALLLLNNISGV